MSQFRVQQVDHIELYVPDQYEAARWYKQVFGIGYRMEEPHDGGVGKLLADEQMRLIIVLHHHDANQGESFSERRTGLDHVGLSVPSRADLEAWQRHLQELGVVQSPITDRPYGSVLVFRDPDNIQLELFAPPAS